MVTRRTPSWDRLFDFAVGQEGHFTTKQAAEAGYSPQLLFKYLKNGRIIRVRRGVYRIVHFPAAEHEDLATLWLWSDQAGVFSHETALMLPTWLGVEKKKASRHEEEAHRVVPELSVR